MTDANTISIALNILPFFIGINVSTAINYAIVENKIRLSNIMSVVCLVSMILSLASGLFIHFLLNKPDLNINYFSYYFVVVMLTYNYRYLTLFLKNNKKE